MPFRPFEVNAPHLAYTFLGGFIVIFGMCSLFIKERLYIGEAPIAVVTGIIIGPYVLGFFDPLSWGSSNSAVTDEITLEVTRVIIAISVFAVGVELPKAYMKRHWRSLFFLLGPCMIWGWMIAGLLIWALIPGLNFLSALLVAAAVTPTDPILAQAVIGGKFADKHVPAHIRHLLSAESGSNDGAAFPFLGIALYLTLDKSDGHAVGEWIYYTILYEVVLGVILGALLGFSARKIMKLAERKRLIDRQSYVAQYISLAVLSIGATSLLGSDDLLSAFACGTAFAWDGFFNKATEDALFSNVIDLLFNVAAFIYIGAIMPFKSFNDAELGLNFWRLIILAIGILLIRRLPIILALYRWIPDIKTFREAAFTGWFGPMGVGAVFIVTLARTELPEGDPDADTVQVDLLRQTMQPIVLFLVLSSVIMHGLSIPFFSLGRRVHSITYTWSRNPSMDNRREEPAWTTHARRITPGEEIIINRDDDAEEGDLGLRRSRTADTAREKMAEGEKVPDRDVDDSGGSSSSRTVAVGDEIEMKDRQSSGEASDMSGGQRETADNEGNEDDDDGGQRTPPLAEYREGNHLIIERNRGEGEEIEVEVIRNHYSDKPAERSTFKHPHPLKHKEVDELITHLPKSIEHAISRVQDGGAHAIDSLGLGLMRPSSSVDSLEARPRSTSPADAGPSTRTPRRDEQGLTNDQEGDLEEEGETESDEEQALEDTLPNQSRTTKKSRLKPKTPKTAINTGKRRNPLQRLFGGLKSGNSGESTAEEGRGSPDPGLQSPPAIASPRKIQPYPSRTDRNQDLSLSRTLSVPRTTSIRFAPDSSPSSNAAPGSNNYGNNAPGFKRNPTLAMFRAPSVHSDDEIDESPTVKFKLPDKRR